MFRRQRRAREAEPPASQGEERERFTYLEQGTVVTGTLAATGRLRVHGLIRGDVDVDGLIEVAPDGVIEGTCVKASALVILGRVVANVRVTGKVEVWRDAHLEGDVWASALDIEEGATFRGRSDMPQRAATPRLGAPALAGEAAPEVPTVADAVPAPVVEAGSGAPIVEGAAAERTVDARPGAPIVEAAAAERTVDAGSGIPAVAPASEQRNGALGAQAPAEYALAAEDAPRAASQSAEREDMQSRT